MSSGSSQLKPDQVDSIDQETGGEKVSLQAVEVLVQILNHYVLVP